MKWISGACATGGLVLLCTVAFAGTPSLQTADQQVLKSLRGGVAQRFCEFFTDCTSEMIGAKDGCGEVVQGCAPCGGVTQCALAAASCTEDRELWLCGREWDVTCSENSLDCGVIYSGTCNVVAVGSCGICLLPGGVTAPCYKCQGAPCTGGAGGTIPCIVTETCH